MRHDLYSRRSRLRRYFKFTLSICCYTNPNTIVKARARARARARTLPGEEVEQLTSKADDDIQLNK